MVQPNVQAVTEKYRSLDTKALIELWSRDDRMPWAESILRSELSSRGIESEVLDSISQRREAVALADSERLNPAEFSMFGPALALFGGGFLSGIAKVFLGTQAALLVGIAICGVFAKLLWSNLDYRSNEIGGGFTYGIMKGYFMLLCTLAAMGVMAYYFFAHFT